MFSLWVTLHQPRAAAEYLPSLVRHLTSNFQQPVHPLLAAETLMLPLNLHTRAGSAGHRFVREHFDEALLLFYATAGWLGQVGTKELWNIQEVRSRGASRFSRSQGRALISSW